MEQPPRFDFRDVLVAPARALAPKQILVMTGFACFALILYVLGFYAAIAIDGQSFDLVYSVYGLFPFASPDVSNFGALLVFGVGIAAALFAIMLGFFAVAAINIESLRGNPFLSASAAARFAFARSRQIIFSELTMLSAVALVALFFVLLGLISRIPYIGQLIYSIFFAIPSFVIAVLTTVVLFVLSISILLTPAVAAAERTNESFSAIVETFSSVTRQPFRWLAYTIYAVVAAKICSFVYAYFAYRAVELALWSSSLGGGDGIWVLAKSALWHLPVKSQFVHDVFNVFTGISWGFAIPNLPYLPFPSLSGYVLAIMLFLIFASIIGYALAIIAAAQARGYVVIRYLKDTYKITEEKSLFFKEDHVNPPISGEQHAAS